MKPAQVIAILLLLFAADFATAEIYRWTDADGRVHFGDKPIDTKIQAEEVNVRDYKPGSDAQTREIIERRERLMNAGAEKSRQETSQTTLKAAVQARDEKRCAEARDDLLKVSGRVQFYDEQGKPVLVSEPERVARQRQLQEWVKANCP